MITIEPLGGLCNRLRACASACTLALAINRPLTVLWNIDGTLGCRFDELFIVPAQVTRLVHINKKNFFSRNAHKLIDRFSTKTGFRLWQPDMERMLKQNYDFRLLAHYPLVRMATCSAFYPAASLLQFFVPVPNLQLIIDSYKGTLQNAIGVHMRRTDNAIAVDNSPTELFISAMHKEIAADPRIKFFLATDSPEEEHRLQLVFPNRVITHEKKNMRRDDPLAVKDAVIDLFLLSNCRKIIGSYWSSFTETAHALGSADICIIKKPQEKGSC